MNDSVTRDDIRKNYSKVGTDLIERLYGDHSLSLSGEQSSDRMIELAGISASCRVLDVGSGVGGPALHLAEKTGCSVTGVDIVEWNVAETNQRAAARGLADKAEFKVGDAMALPFPDGAFDTVWSQDAWCHVPDKRQVIAEAARAVKADGCVAFTDWVALAPMEPDYLAEVQSAVASPNFGSTDAYAGWLEAEGCAIIDQTDISQRFTARYRTMIANLKAMEAELSEQFSTRVYGIMLEKNGMILQAFEDGKLGGVQMVARKG